jgi:hypothetical protein
MEPYRDWLTSNLERKDSGSSGSLNARFRRCSTGDKRIME